LDVGTLTRNRRGERQNERDTDVPAAAADGQCGPLRRPWASRGWLATGKFTCGTPTLGAEGIIAQLRLIKRAKERTVKPAVQSKIARHLVTGLRASRDACAPEIEGKLHRPCARKNDGAIR